MDRTMIAHLAMFIAGLALVVAVTWCCEVLQTEYVATHHLPIAQTDCWLPFQPAPWTEGC